MAVYVCKTYFDCVDRATDHVARFVKNLDNPIIIFCEDKLTLEVERQLAKKRGGNFNAEVLSLGRYASKRLSYRKHLSKEGMAMAVKRILSEHAHELTALKKSAESPSLASETSEVIAQLKSAKITPGQLKSAAENLQGKIADKIRDVAVVFGAYENFLKENSLTDSNNALSDIPEAVKKDTALKDTAVVFIGFSSITKQSAEAIEVISRAAGKTDYFAVYGENEDLFVNEFYSFVKKFDKTPTACQSSATDEAKLLLSRLFDPTTFSKNGKPTEKIWLYEADDVLDEAEYAAKTIRNLIIKNEIRYRDVAIGVSDLNAYALPLKRKLADYGIPFYSDEKTKLSSAPIATLADALLKAASSRGDLDDIKEIVGNCCFIPDKTKSDEALRAITLSSLTYKTFIGGLLTVGDEYVQSRINVLAGFLRKLKRRDSAKNYADALRNFLTECEAEENAKIVSERLREYGADEQAAVATSQTEKFYGILDETEAVLGNAELSSESLARILLSGENACEISVVQQRNDCVYVGDLKNCRFRRYDVLFALGLTSDVPATQNDGTLILDGDIAALEKLKVVVEPKIKVVNDREKEAVGLALASFEKKLILTRPSLAKDGKPTASSSVTDYFEKIFSDEKSRFTVFSSSDMKFGKESAERKSFDYLAKRPAFFSLVKKSEDMKEGATDECEEIASLKAAFEKLGDEDAVKACEKLVNSVNSSDGVTEANLPAENYFADKNVSASAIETFYSCPYKCFMQYCLGIKDSATGEIRPLDYGNVLHRVAELFVGRIDELGDEDDCVKLCDEITDEILKAEEYERFNRRPSFAYALERLKNEARHLCVKIFNEFKVSGFKPLYREVWFGDGGKMPAFPLQTKRDGYKLQGKIDRVDVYESRDGSGEKYGRIIDYKSGKAEDKVKEKNFYTGLHLQLYLYLNALKNAGYIPSGAYFYALDEAFKKIENSEKAVSMYGKTLNDDEILRATDSGFFDNEKSKIIDAKIRHLKSGDKTDGSVESTETLDAYMRYAEILATKAVNGILDGFIPPSPYKGECEYCEYGSACGFDEDSGSAARNVSKSIYPQNITKAVNAARQAETTGEKNDENR